MPDISFCLLLRPTLQITGLTPQPTGGMPYTAQMTGGMAYTAQVCTLDFRTFPTSLGEGGGCYTPTCLLTTSGIAYQDRDRRPDTVVNHKRETINSRGCYQAAPSKHLVLARPANILAKQNVSLTGFMS
jgi:hypothetical protein